jgi:hypothetical protein
MKKNLMLRIATNQHRYYFVGGIFIAVLLGTLTTSALTNNQLLAQERKSAAISATLPLSHFPASLIDAPYHLAQKISLHFFEITTFGVKLPSIILAIFVGLGIVYLLRRWLMRSNVAIFTSLIAITNVHFTYVATTGSPLIMLLFWPLCLFLVGLKLVRYTRSLSWALILSVLLGLSLYTPLMIYIAILMLVLMILHPHLRHLVKNIPPLHLILSILVVIILISPLLYSLIQQPKDLLVLLGKPDTGFSLSIIKENFFDVSRALVQFWYPTFTELGPHPLFSAPTLVLIAYGFATLVMHHYSARSYGLMILFPVLLFFSILNPTLMSILLIPCILLLAIGIESFLSEWYKLFPFNPYARIAALLPLSILMGSIMITNIMMFQNIYRYHQSIADNYDRDLALVRPLFDRYPNARLITAPADQPFYDLLRRDYPRISVSENSIQESRPVITAAASGIFPTESRIPHFLITDFYKDREPRFYVYTQ